MLKGYFDAQLEKGIELLKPYPLDDIKEVLAELSKGWGGECNPPDRAFLNWSEIREMGRSGLISFGSHTVDHKILTTISEEDVKDELMKSRKKLIEENVFNSTFIPFCYPNGNYNKQIPAMVSSAGYNLALTTENGWNSINSNLFTLKRVGVHQDMTSIDALFGCRIANII